MTEKMCSHKNNENPERFATAREKRFNEKIINEYSNATKLSFFFNNDMFQSQYRGMRIPAYNVQLPVLYAPGFPKEPQESFILDRFGQQQGIPVGQRSRKLFGRQNSVKVIPSIPAMNRNGRNPYGIPDNYHGIFWYGQQINDGLGLRFVYLGQIPILVLQLPDNRRIFGPEPFKFLDGQFKRLHPGRA